MNDKNVTDHREYGAAILRRLAGQRPPATLRPYVRAFRAAHTAYERAALVGAAARTTRDKALRAVGLADDALDESIDALADAVVGARLATRVRPFAAWSTLAPSDLKAQAYSEEAGSALALVAKLRASGPPAVVARAVADVERKARAVKAAVRAISAPQSRQGKALGARDALVPDWTRALNRLKKHAAADWVDEPETYAAVFAPVEAVVEPKKARKPAKKPPAVAGSDGATGPGSDAVADARKPKR